MLSRTARLLCLSGALAFALVSSASAQDQKPRKQKKAATHSSKVVAGKYWGTNQFRAGPIFNGPDYMGDDPDPFIRSQIWRDMSGRYGGDGG